MAQHYNHRDAKPKNQWTHAKNVGVSPVDDRSLVEFFASTFTSSRIHIFFKAT